MPEEYLNPPELWPHLRFYWDAFTTLGTDRSVGMAEGPIPFSAVDRYARRYGIDDIDDFDVFLRIMRGLDAEYLQFRAEWARQNQKLNEELRKQETPAKPLPKPLVTQED